MNDYNSLIKKYTDKLKDDPKSRTFAPLGEIYRKLGLYKQAIAVYESGIKIHPTYSLGIIGLAQCYFEIDEYQLSYNVLKPYLNLNNDNLKYLNLYAVVCEKLNFIDEALNTYKNILFINPKDKKAKEYIERFEDESLTEISYKVDDPLELDALDTGLNEWSQLNLLDPIGEIDEPIVEDENVEAQAQQNIDEEPSKPIFSHTLVDLYVQGGATDKAIEILESAIINNPDDIRSVERLEELKNVLTQEKEKDDKIEAVDSGHDNLMKVFDEKVKEPVSDDSEAEEKETLTISEDDIVEKVEMAYSLFLSHLKSKSREMSL